jgi:hypothetical protein
LGVNPATAPILDNRAFADAPSAFGEQRALDEYIGLNSWMFNWCNGSGGPRFVVSHSCRNETASRMEILYVHHPHTGDRSGRERGPGRGFGLPARVVAGIFREWAGLCGDGLINRGLFSL